MTMLQESSLVSFDTWIAYSLDTQLNACLPWLCMIKPGQDWLGFPTGLHRFLLTALQMVAVLI